MSKVEELSEEELNNQIKEAPSKKLAGFVIAYRLLGLYKTIAEKCMSELMIRKENGDSFSFEEYIESEIKEIPKPQVKDISKINSFLKINWNKS